jgi:hypothetical protein
MADDNLTRLIEHIEELLKSTSANETKLRRALSLAAEASRTPAGARRIELIRDARELMRQAREGGTTTAAEMLAKLERDHGH